MDWTEVEISLKALDPWEDNPKSISEANAKRLLDLWNRIGQFQTVAIGPDGEVYDGHQRLSVLLSAYGPDYVIKALRSPRALSQEERQELTIAAHVGTTGDWDWEALEEWDITALQEWGLDYDTLAIWNRDTDELRRLFGEEVDVDDLWDGMPEFEQEDMDEPFLTLKVHFDTAEAVALFSKKIGQTVTDKSKFIRFPKKTDIEASRYRVVSTEGDSDES